MKNLVILMGVFAVFLVLSFSFSSAIECLGGNGEKMIDGRAYCSGNVLVSETCNGLSAFRESRLFCEYGCDSINKICKDSYSAIYHAKPNGTIIQEVKCLFSNSNAPQVCSYSIFNCTGTDSCILGMYAYPWENVSLTSSCSGSPIVRFDGKPQKSVSFDCNSQQKRVENVTCIFKNATKEEKCFSGNYSCSGIGECVVSVYGIAGDKFDWKSTCGGDDTTIIDYGNQNGGNDYALFYCGEGGEQIPAFRQAYALCYDGYDLYKGSKEDCKTEESWRYVMEGVCDGRCTGSYNCGVKRFKAFTPCGNIVFVRPTGEEGSLSLNDTNSQCKGCKKDGKCYAFGNRDKSDYCFYDGSIKNYSIVGEACEKEYQCKSNRCVNSICGPNGIFEKISVWFKGLFKK
jgi:hypothetical protein